LEAVKGKDYMDKRDMSDWPTLTRFADRPSWIKQVSTALQSPDRGMGALLPRPVRAAVTDGQRAEDRGFADPSRPTLFAVLDELGLKLESQTDR